MQRNLSEQGISRSDVQRVWPSTLQSQEVADPRVPVTSLRPEVTAEQKEAMKLVSDAMLHSERAQSGHVVTIKTREMNPNVWNNLSPHLQGLVTREVNVIIDMHGNAAQQAVYEIPPIPTSQRNRQG